MKVTLSAIKNTQPHREHGDIGGLKASITDVGLISPLTLDSEYNLLAGRRRFQAVSELGWPEVDCHILPVNGDRLKAFRIAIDENLKRKPLTDPEVAIAIKEYDELKRKVEGNAQGGTRTDLGHTVTEVKGWSLQKTANDLGISKPAVVKSIKIATAIEKHPELCIEKRGRNVLRKAESIERRAELEKKPRIVGKQSNILPLEALWPTVKSLLLNRADWVVRLGLARLKEYCREEAEPEEMAIPEVAAAMANMEQAFKSAESLIKAAAAELERVAESAPDNPIPWPPSQDRQHQLLINAHQKNLAGYCSELGCWEEAGADGLCWLHGPAAGGAWHCPGLRLRAQGERASNCNPVMLSATNSITLLHKGDENGLSESYWNGKKTAEVAGVPRVGHCAIIGQNLPILREWESETNRGAPRAAYLFWHNED